MRFRTASLVQARCLHRPGLQPSTSVLRKHPLCRTLQRSARAQAHGLWPPLSPDIASQLDELWSKQCELWSTEEGLFEAALASGFGEVKTGLDIAKLLENQPQFPQWLASRVIKGGYIRLYLRLDGKDIERSMGTRKRWFDMGPDGVKTSLQKNFGHVGKGELKMSELEPPGQRLSEIADGEWELYRNLAEAFVLVVKTQDQADAKTM